MVERRLDWAWWLVVFRSGDYWKPQANAAVGHSRKLSRYARGIRENRRWQRRQRMKSVHNKAQMITERWKARAQKLLLDVCGNQGVSRQQIPSRMEKQMGIYIHLHHKHYLNCSQYFSS